MNRAVMSFGRVQPRADEGSDRPIGRYSFIWYWLYIGRFITQANSGSIYEYLKSVASVPMSSIVDTQSVVSLIICVELPDILLCMDIIRKLTL
jgi:hypothetical protein